MLVLGAREHRIQSSFPQVYSLRSTVSRHLHSAVYSAHVNIPTLASLFEGAFYSLSPR